VAYLVDSSILSGLFKKGESGRICQQWLKDHPDIFTSVIVIYEIESGLIHAGMTKSLSSFEKFIEIAPIKVLDVSREIASIAAAKRAETLSSGLTINAQDLLIGATAARHNLKIVTANVKDFKCWGTVENPYASSL
jgi:predicted nucleic acid-binding protein